MNMCKICKCTNIYRKS